MWQKGRRQLSVHSVLTRFCKRVKGFKNKKNLYGFSVRAQSISLWVLRTKYLKLHNMHSHFSLQWGSWSSFSKAVTLIQRFTYITLKKVKFMKFKLLLYVIRYNKQTILTHSRSGHTIPYKLLEEVCQISFHAIMIQEIIWGFIL